MSLIVSSSVKPSSTTTSVTPSNTNLKVQQTTIAKAQTLRSVSSLGIGLAGGNQKMTINDAIDAYTKNPANVTGPVDLTGSTADLSANFAVLALMANDNKLGTITLTNAAPLTFDRNALPGAWDAANGQSKEIKVLQAIKSKVSVTVQNATVDDVLNLKAPKALKLSFEVTDTAASVKTNIVALSKAQAKGNLASLSIVDDKDPISLTAAEYTKNNALIKFISGTPSITLTNVKAADASKLAQMARVTSIAVEDTGENITKNVSALNTLQGSSKINEIKVTDGKFSLTALQATSNTDLIDAKFNNGSNGAVAITVTDVAVADIDTFKNSFATNQTLSLTQQVKDTALAISSALAKLEASVDHDLVDRIQVSSGTDAIEFSNKEDYLAHADSLNLMRGAYTLKINSINVTDALAFAVPNSNAQLKLGIEDSASAIASNFDNLQKFALANKLYRVASNDGQAANIAITATQALSSKELLAKLDGNYNITVSAAKAADVSRIKLLSGVGAKLSAINVEDTGANITKNASALNALGSQLGTIKTLGSQASDDAITLTEAQALASPSLLAAKFIASTAQKVTLNVTGVTVANAVSISRDMASNSTINGREFISDTAAAIDSGLNDLGSVVANAANISSIKVNNGGDITLDDVGDYLRNRAALDLITTGVYTLKTTKASVADISTFTTGAQKVRDGVKLGFEVEDTAKNISDGLSGLSGLANKGQLTSLKSTDGTAANVVVAASQVGAYSAVLDKLVAKADPFKLQINGATASQAAVWATKYTTNLAKLNIEDTGDNISNKLSSLKTIANSSQLGTVNISDGTITLDSAALTGASNLFAAKFINGQGAAPITVNVNNVSLSNMETFRSLVNANQALSIKQNIEASGTVISANLDKLVAAKADQYVDTVRVNDWNDITIANGAEYTRNSSIIDNLLGRFTLKVTQASVADLTALNGNSSATNKTITVNDTSDNIANGLTALKSLADAGQLTVLTSSDGTGKNIKISAADLDSNLNVFEKMSASSRLEVDSVTAARALELNAKFGTQLAGLNIDDSAVNIQDNLAALKAIASKVNSVKVTGGALTVNSSDLDTSVTGTATLFGTKFINGAVSTDPVTINVKNVDIDDIDTFKNFINANKTLSVKQNITDTGADVTAHLDRLSAAKADLYVDSVKANDWTEITVTDGVDYLRNKSLIDSLQGRFTLKATVASVADISTIKTNSLPATNFDFQIKDSADNIAGGLTQLKSLADDGQLTSVTTVEGSAKTIKVSAADLAANMSVFEKLSVGSRIEIDGVTAAKALEYATKFGSKLERVNIDDTAANIQSNLAALKGIAGKISTVKVASGALTVNASDLDTSVAGTATLFAASFVNGTTAANKVTVNVNNVDITDMETFRSLINSNITLDIKQNIKDSGTDVSGNLDKLLTGKTANYVSSVTVNDWDDVTVNDKSIYDRDSALINSLLGRFTLKTTNAVSISDATGMTVPGMKTSFRISDTAANIQDNFTSLITDYANGKISSLVSQDGTTKAITLSATQLSQGWSLLQKMATGSDFTLHITGVKAADVTAIQSGIASLGAHANLSTIDIDDTSNNVVANIDTLNTLAGSNKLGDVKVGATDVLTLTQAQVDNAADFLNANFVAGSTTDPVNVTLIDVHADKTDDTYVAVAKNPSLAVTGVYVKDTADAIETAIADLQKGTNSGAATSILKGIFVNDYGTIDLTATDTSSNTNALDLVSGPHTLAVSGGMLVADALAAVSGASSDRKFSFEIADSSANVTAALSTLADWAAKGTLTKLTMTDDLTLTAAEATTAKPLYASVLDLATNSAKIVVSGTALELLANEPALSVVKNGTNSITTTDTSITLSISDAKKLDNLLDSGSQLADIITGGGDLTINDWLDNILANSTDPLVVAATDFTLLDSGTVTITSAQETTLTNLGTANPNFTAPSYNLI